MNLGWIKLHRKLLDHPRFNDEGWLRVWVALLLLANHSRGGQKRIFKGKEIELEPGQLITSRESLARTANLHPSTIERILAKLKTEQQIEQATDFQSRLITITCWDEYQIGEQRFEQRSNSDRTAPATAIEQRVIHTQEWENGKNGKKRERASALADATTPVPPLSTFSIEAAGEYGKGLGLPQAEIESFLGACVEESQRTKYGISLTEWRPAMDRWKRRYVRYLKDHGIELPTKLKPQRVDRNTGTLNAGKADQYAGVGKLKASADTPAAATPPAASVPNGKRIPIPEVIAAMRQATL